MKTPLSLQQVLTFGAGLWICFAVPVQAQVTLLTDRASFEESVDELVLFEENFESLTLETTFSPTPAQLFGNHLTIAETNTNSSVNPNDLNRTAQLADWIGRNGIDSAALSGRILLGRVQAIADRGAQELSFTLDFGNSARGIGFDISGANGGSTVERGPRHGFEVTTRSGMVLAEPFMEDDGFFGFVSAPGDPIVKLRLYDRGDDSVLGAEVSALDNLVIAAEESPKVEPTDRPYTTFRVDDPEPDVHLGNSVAATGDLDGDGVPDFAVSGWSGDVGLVRAISGRDGGTLYTFDFPGVGQGFGERRNLTSVGDLDGDGAAEIAVGIPWGISDEPLGFFQIHRGRDGALLRTHRGGLFESLGHEIAALGDLDGDAIPDYAASTFEPANEGGYVAIFSGGGGGLLGRIVGAEAVRFYSIVGPGDLDGDGKGDLAVSLWSEEGVWQRGEVRILSGNLFGTDGAPAGDVALQSSEAEDGTLLTMTGRTDLSSPPSGFEYLGLGLNAVGDINGDGIPDLGVGTGPADDAIIFSGADGSRLHEWSSDQLRVLSQLVLETGGVGDLNQDGVGDVVIGRAGSVSVRSGKDGSLLAEVTGDGRLGEEIAVIGDLDDDGVSEVLAGAPDSGYASVISFSLSPKRRPRELSAYRQGDRIVISWNRAFQDAILEQSNDLTHWVPVTGLMFENLLVLASPLPRELFFRLRENP